MKNARFCGNSPIAESSNWTTTKRRFEIRCVYKHRHTKSSTGAAPRWHRSANARKTDANPPRPTYRRTFFCRETLSHSRSSSRLAAHRVAMKIESRVESTTTAVGGADCWPQGAGPRAQRTHQTIEITRNCTILVAS